MNFRVKESGGGMHLYKHCNNNKIKQLLQHAAADQSL